MSILLAATQIVKARQVFEIGTFLGNTTLNLALNIPPDGTVFTLDLDAQHASGMKQDVADAPLTQKHLESKSALDFSGSPVEGKIKTLTGDSTKFDFSPWHNSIDLVLSTAAMTSPQSDPTQKTPSALYTEIAPPASCGTTTPVPLMKV